MGSIGCNKVQKLIKETLIDETATPALLPSMHSTTCHKVESVLEQDMLSATKCPVFNEMLLYFFYGKPSYKVSRKYAEARTDNVILPCCFILDSKKISAKYVYPFDSGAYKSGIFDKIIPKGINIEDFQLNSAITEIPKYIQIFFQNNTNYLQGISTLSGECIDNSVTESLATLLKSTGAFDFDDRSKSVEIISSDNLKLSDALLAIVVPRPFLRNACFQQFKKNNPNIDVLTYYTHYPNFPSGYNEAVFQKVIDYLGNQKELL